MTDNEIIKALECRIDNFSKSVLDLINRKNAEIERLEKESNDKERVYTDEYCLRKEWQRRCRELLEEKQNTKSEAIKEFAKRAENISVHGNIDVDDFSDLVKEMTEDTNG